MKPMFSTVFALVALAVLAMGCEPPEGNLQFGETTGTDVVTETSKDGGSTGDSCVDTSDCAAGSYCVTSSCGAAEGVCQPQPQSCSYVLLPVCGCDGQTYSNACQAASSGVSVASEGACGVVCAEMQCPPNSVAVDSDGDGCPDKCQEVGPGFCQSNGDCGASEFCDAACGQPGTCVAKPTGCFGVYLPVCGCDDQTYGNSCDANQSGVSVAYDGECKVDCPAVGCPAGQAAVDTDGDGCAESCIPQSEACVPDMMLTDAPGAPFVEPGCGSGEFCQATAGTCGTDGTLGVCVPQGKDCPNLYAPVCGCDGNTYSSACEATNAGAQKLHDGECKTCDLVIDCQQGYVAIDTDGDGCDDTCVPGGAPCGGADPFACGPNQFCESYEGTCAFGAGTPGAPPEPTDPGGDAAVPWVPGTCVDTPQICPDVYAPVCGCDGVTYGNDCERRSAAVSKEHGGACKVDCPPIAIDCPPGQSPYDSNGDGCVDACQPAPTWCLVSADCPNGSYCAQQGCIDGPGACEPIPTACPDVYAPVCGCDGQTYGNSCEAAAAGASVAGVGECGGGPGCGGFSGIPCAEGEFCEGPQGLCGGSDFGGKCVLVPEICDDIFAPVCGCDGKTYSNDCERQAAQATTAYEGECNDCDATIDCVPGYQPFDSDGDGCNDSCKPVSESCGGFVGGDCPNGTVCDPYEGQCGWTDVPGQCVPAGSGCDATNAEPVCGCDGKTYGNDCLRLEAGVAKDYSGVCDSCPAILCPEGMTGLDSDGDGCDDECVPAGCDTGIACADGGVAIDSDGDGCKDQCVQGPPCGGADGTFMCGPEQFCELDAGACAPFEGDGGCMTPPNLCPLVVAPVCGCDGVTYSNDCERQSLGVAKWSDGPCDDTSPSNP